MKEQDSVDGILEQDLNNRAITTEVQDSFKKILKKGIYKELYRRNMLSDAQLNLLINQ